MARKRRLEHEDMLALARLGVADSLRSGITTSADYSFSGASATAATELGLRAIVYLEVFAQDPAVAAAQFDEKRGRIAECALVRIGISPHAPVHVLARRLPAGASRSASRSARISPSGERERLARAGRQAPGRDRGDLVPRPANGPSRRSSRCSGPDLLCAHCVEVDEGEIALLAARGVPVAHCPRSNALLGCGVAPLAELRAAGVAVGLGTDSPASTPSFDVFEEMRAAIYAARARERRPEALLAAEDALRSRRSRRPAPCEWTERWVP